MTTTEKAADNILEGVFSVYAGKEHYINTNNNGILNAQNIQRERLKFLKDSIGYLYEYLVDFTQGYPENDISKVKLSTDFVVMKRDEFEFVKTIFNELIQDKYDQHENKKTI